MKKILIAIVCLALMCCFSMSAFAETVEPPIAPEETLTNEVNWDEVKGEVSAFILNWVKPHIEEISVIITLVFYVIASTKDRKNLNKN